MPLSVVGEPTVVITIQTRAGFSGVAMPISASVLVSMPDVENLVAVPEMNLGVEFGELTSHGLYMELRTSIANSNPFGVEVDDLDIVARGQSGDVLFTSKMDGCSIEPDSTGTLSGEILMPLEVMNEPDVVIGVETRAGIDGITLPISAQLTVGMPDMQSLVTIPKVKIQTKPSWECGFPLPSLHIETASAITNKGNLDLKICDIQVSFFDSNDELVHEMTIPGGIVKAHSCKKFRGSATLCDSEYLRLICGEDFRVEVATKAGISGVDTVFPVQASMTTVLSSLFELPEVDLGIDFGELASDGLHMGLQTILCNPNPFGIDVQDLLVVAKNQSGDVLFTSNMSGLTIGPDSTGTLLGDLLVPLDVLDESTIVFTIEGLAGFGGVDMPVNGKITVKMPDIRNLVAIPETDLDVDFWELTPDGLHMGLQANVTNPNPFGIDVDDLQIVAKTRSGNVILSSSIQGCSIEPNSAGTISGDLLMPLGVLDRSTVVIKIQTEAGFAEIALPVNAKMTVKMPDIRDLFAVPQISLGVRFGEITPDGLPVALQATIANPNPFGIDLGNLQIVATSQLGDVILTSGTVGCAVDPSCTTTLSVDLLLPLDCLDEPTIVITIQTEAGFAGFILPVSENIVLVNMPDVQSGIGG
jgi:LEA14-like dessication related protein